MSEPALVLTPPETGTAEDDGLLTASEIGTLDLDADWVILSACNTADCILIFRLDRYQSRPFLLALLFQRTAVSQPEALQGGRPEAGAEGPDQKLQCAEKSR